MTNSHFAEKINLFNDKYAYKLVPKNYAVMATCDHKLRLDGYDNYWFSGSKYARDKVDFKVIMKEFFDIPWLLYIYVQLQYLLSDASLKSFILLILH